MYRSTPSECRSCPRREECGANEKGQKMVHRHIWSEYLDLVEQLRKTERGKALYAKRKESIERVFGDAKEKHAMRYTHHRGLARVTNWVTLKFACMNLKKLATWSWNSSAFTAFLPVFSTAA
ncbi:MAG: transposase [Oscillospiraceae bacterium]